MGGEQAESPDLDGEGDEMSPRRETVRVCVCVHALSDGVQPSLGGARPPLEGGEGAGAPEGTGVRGVWPESTVAHTGTPTRETLS